MASSINNVGVMTMGRGARIQNTLVVNRGWANLDGIRADRSVLANSGVLSTRSAAVAANTIVRNGGWLNLDEARIGASRLNNTGVLTIKNTTAGGAPTKAPMPAGVHQIGQYASVTQAAPAKPGGVLPKYPGTTIDASGVEDLSKYDLSDVIHIKNGGWLALNGTLRSDVVIENTGVMAVRGAGATQLDAAQITNSGWLSIE